MGSTADLWQNESLLFNMSAANASSVNRDLLSPVMNKTINILIIITILITMVSLGCTMEVSKIKHHIMRPKGVAIAVLAQYGVMPLTAFCLAKGFDLPEIPAVVVLISGCCPGGNLSNLLTLALQGDMNLSIVMTCCSTLLALGMMPLLLYIYCQGFPNLQKSVPYLEIIISLFTIIIPSSIGILINYYKPQYAKIITKVGIILMSIAIVSTGVVSSIAIGSSILTVLSPSLMAIGAIMPFVGFTLGYVISSLFRLKQLERRTISVETGCQNFQVCATILKMAFPQEVIGYLFFVPMVFLAFQLMEAAVLIVLFRCYQWLTHKEKETYQPAQSEAERVPEEAV